jgi:hypothetical protein
MITLNRVPVDIVELNYSNYSTFLSDLSSKGFAILKEAINFNSVESKQSLSFL